MQSKAPSKLVAVPYISLFNAKIITSASGEDHLLVDRHFFQFCIRSIVSKIQVDEEWYLQRYPDILDAIENGRIASARMHYERHGYFENRMPYPIKVDAVWYLEQYSDVAEGIERGEFSSAQAHFDDVGFAEGRFPFPRFTLSVSADDDNPVRSIRLLSSAG